MIIVDAPEPEDQALMSRRKLELRLKGDASIMAESAPENFFFFFSFEKKKTLPALRHG